MIEEAKGTQPVSPATPAAAPVPNSAGRAGRFARHYLEMVVAMAVGMVAIGPVLGLAIPEASGAEVDSLVMATSMSVAMAAWMRFRRHRVGPIVEMSLAMYAGFVVLFPLLWSGHIDAAGLMAGGHVLMLLFMAAAMLLRPAEYAVKHAH
jgi:hypothetical protein